MLINDFLLKYRRPFFDKEDEGGGGGDGGGDGGKAGGDGGGDGGEGGKEGGGDGSKLDAGLLGRRKSADKADDEGGDGGKKSDDGRPEGVPDKFWDADKKTVRTDDLTKAYAALEKDHGKLKREKSIGGEVPESADDYFPDGLDLGEEVDRLAIEGPDDPGLKAWGNICLKYGIGKELATNLAKDMFGEMNEHAPMPIDPDAEYDALGKNADAVIDGVFVWLDGAAKSGHLSDDALEQAAELSKTARGMKFLSAMRSMAGEDRIPNIPGSGAKAMSAKEWHSEMKDAVKAKDYKRQAELDAMSADIIGDHPSSGGPAGGVDPEMTRRSK